MLKRHQQFQQGGYIIIHLSKYEHFETPGVCLRSQSSRQVSLADTVFSSVFFPVLAFAVTGRRRGRRCSTIETLLLGWDPVTGLRWWQAVSVGQPGARVDQAGPRWTASIGRSTPKADVSTRMSDSRMPIWLHARGAGRLAVARLVEMACAQCANHDAVTRSGITWNESAIAFITQTGVQFPCWIKPPNRSRARPHHFQDPKVLAPKLRSLREQADAIRINIIRYLPGFCGVP